VREGTNLVRRSAVRVLLALAFGALALSGVSSAAESTFQPPAIYECLEQSARAVIDDETKRDSRFVFEQMGKDTISEGIWEQCSSQHPSDVSRVDRKAAASLVEKALLDRIEDGAGVGSRPQLPLDIYVALDLYDKCLTQEALGFAAVSDEPAETIVKAAFAACKIRQVALYAVYLDRGEHLDNEVLARYEKDLEKTMLNDILTERMRLRGGQGEQTQPNPARRHESPL